MSSLATVAAIGVTLAAIGRLAATDPKRRRAFHLAPFQGRRHAAALVALSLSPGPLLLGIGAGAGFLVWLGATTVAGWAIAALSPIRVGRVGTWLAAVSHGLQRVLHAWLKPDRSPTAADSAVSARIVELEGRVAALEAALVVARGGGIESLSDFQMARTRRTGEA